MGPHRPAAGSRAQDSHRDSSCPPRVSRPPARTFTRRVRVSWARLFCVNRARRALVNRARVGRGGGGVERPSGGRGCVGALPGHEEYEEWLQHHSEAGSSWPSWPKASYGGVSAKSDLVRKMFRG